MKNRALLRSRASLVGVVVGLPLSAFFLWLAVRKADHVEVWSVLSNADLAFVVLAIMALGGVYTGQAIRWRVIARTPMVSAPRFAEMVLSGVAVNNVLPGRVGDLLRARWLQVAACISGGRALATVFVDRVFDVLALVVFLAISLPFISGAEWIRRIAIGGFVLLLVLSIVFAAARAYAHYRARDRRGHRGRLRGIARDALEGLAEPLGPVRAVALALFSVGTWSMWALAAWLVGQAVGIELSMLDVVFVTAVINLGVAIPSSPGFIGTYQWLGVSALALFHIETDQALAFAILMHAVWYVPTCLAGGFLLSRRGIAKLRNSAFQRSLSMNLRMHDRSKLNHREHRGTGMFRRRVGVHDESRVDAELVRGVDIKTEPGPLVTDNLTSVTVTPPALGYSDRLRWIPPACAAALGLWQLGEPSLWIDEAYTAERTGFTYGRLMEDIQWAHFTLVKAWSVMGGTSEFALRFPSVVGGIVAVVLMYGFTKWLVDERVAFISALLLAVNPFVIHWSQQARAYSILLALAIAATWLFLRAIEKNTALAWAGYGVLVAVLIYWQTFSAFIFVAVHVFLAWRNRRALVTWALVLVVTTPWLIAFFDREAEMLPTKWIPSPTFDSIVDFLREAPGAWGVGLVVASIGTLYIGGRERRLLIAWALLPMALSLIASLQDAVFVSRYLIVSTPAFAMLGAVALIHLAGRLRAVAIGATIAGTAVGLGLWYAPNGSKNWIGEDWKAATEFVMRDGGAIVRPDLARAAYAYYGGVETPTGWVLLRSVEPVSDGHDSKKVSFGERLQAIRVERVRPNAG